MFNIIQAGHTNCDTTAILLNQYRMFYKMPSDIDATSRFINDRLTLNDSLIYLALSKSDIHNTQIDAKGFIQIYPSYSSIAMKPTWVLNDLFITEEARRQGCATQLINHIEEQAREQNIFSVKLATNISNSKAQSLYHSLGYKINDSFTHYSKHIG